MKIKNKDTEYKMTYNYSINEYWNYTFKYDDKFIAWMNRRIKSKEECVQEEKDRLTKSFDHNMKNFKMMTECIENEVKTEIETIIKSLTRSFAKRLEESIKEVEDSYSVKEQLDKIPNFYFELDEKNKEVTYSMNMGCFGRYDYEEDIPYYRKVIYADNKWHVNNPRKYKDELYSELGNSSKKFTLLKIEEAVG